MGYRSNISCVIETQTKSLDEIIKEIKESVGQDWTLLKYEKFEKEHLILVSGEWLKWDRDYDFVKGFNNWLNNCDDDDIAIHFMRVGECYDDIEEIIIGEPYHLLYLDRKIYLDI